MANYFLHKYNDTYKSDKQLSYSAIETLQAYPFPGNVRELKNLIKKAVVLSEDRNLDEFIQKSLGYDTPGDLLGSLKEVLPHAGLKIIPDMDPADRSQPLARLEAD